MEPEALGITVQQLENESGTEGKHAVEKSPPSQRAVSIGRDYFYRTSIPRVRSCLASVPVVQAGVRFLYRDTGHIPTTNWDT